MSKAVSGATLLGWQLVAFVLYVTNLTDAALAAWPDPAWFSLLVAVVVSPPKWLIALVVSIGALLCIWALAERLQRPLSE